MSKIAALGASVPPPTSWLLSSGHTAAAGSSAFLACSISLKTMLQAHTQTKQAEPTIELTVSHARKKANGARKQASEGTY